jgi:hypothetical protein
MFLICGSFIDAEQKERFTAPEEPRFRLTDFLRA